MAGSMQIADDMGFRVELERPPSRIVSLVPSWTETLFALGFTSEVVGITKFCVEPVAAVASIPKVGGTKNPDINAIVKLEPELVIANAEENRREDVERLRTAGIPVFTTYPRTVPGAVESILRLGRVLRREPEAAALAKEITLSVISLAIAAACASRLSARPNRRIDSTAPGTVRGYVVNTGIPAARIRSTSSRRFSSALAITNSGSSLMIARTSGFLVPPTFVTDATAATGSTQNFVMPTISELKPSAKSVSVQLGTSETIRRG